MQYDYFREGDIKLLKPMILKNIADKTGVDISTVSRITCNKYVDTPFGMILLKDLFTEGIINEKGEAISNKVIQVAIEDAIEKEDKKNPYTDQQLVAILAKKRIFYCPQNGCQIPGDFTDTGSANAVLYGLSSGIVKKDTKFYAFKPIGYYQNNPHKLTVKK